MVERAAVNREVEGSSPSSGANLNVFNFASRSHLSDETWVLTGEALFCLWEDSFALIAPRNFSIASGRIVAILTAHF